MGHVVEDGEPLWTQADRDVVEGWDAYQDLLCGGCGQPRDEAWTRAEDYRWKGELVTCRPCEALDEVWDEHRKKADADNEVSTHGLKRIAQRGEVPERFRHLAGDG